MFKFFTNKKWSSWSIFGSLIILVSTWYQVQLDVMINEWFGEFYDTLQKALTTPNSVSEKEFILFFFAKSIASSFELNVILTSDSVFDELCHPINGFICSLCTIYSNTHSLVFIKPDCIELFVGL